MPEQRMLLNAAAAGARLGVTPGTLAKWRIYGRGPRFAKIGGLVRYDARELDAWIDAQTRSSTADPGPLAAA